MKWNATLWKQSQEQFKDFIGPLVAGLGRSERRQAGVSYVEGLLLPGQRKSIVPMAGRLGVDGQKLQQFVTDSPWEEQEIWRRIAQEVIPSLEPLEAWVVDETGWLKQGEHSVGVSAQYCGAVGKKANCQVSVEVVVSDGWVAAPVAGRLYLPQSWAEDAPRRAQAGVPATVVFQTKLEMALDLIRQTLGHGVSRAPVLADSHYGDSTDFRQSLRDLGLEFFLQVSGVGHKAWSEPVVTERKTKRYHVVASTPPPRTLAEIAAGFKEQDWKACRWKATDGRARQTRLAWRRVYLQHSMRQAEGRPEEAWLVVDWPAGQAEPYHYYLAHFHQEPAKARCLRLSRSRWHIEQYFQRVKDDLGLDHYEGRSWRGFHHHLVLSALAYLFVLVVYLRAKKNFWCDVGTDAAGDPAVAAEIHRLLLLLSAEIR
jgi:SRSO17 transposase